MTIDTPVKYVADIEATYEDTGEVTDRDMLYLLRVSKAAAAEWAAQQTFIHSNGKVGAAEVDATTLALMLAVANMKEVPT